MAETPPGTRVVPAEWWERFAARLIEVLVFGVLYYILSILLWLFFRTVGLPDDLIVVGAWFLAGAAYTGYEWRALSRRGRTFGKSIMKIRVSPHTGTAALKRALLYPGPAIVMGIPLCNLLAGMLVFAVGLFILIDKPRQRGLHDRWAGTVVVKDGR
ncbi:RDD family protein [Nonomuraea soli]|uniref:Putative RDD family membrane protein YckC n=1 Tax=Nonomuraea soli TaxID=1032476 RepID=A0A7W0CJG3_9ACTN|nr:RDD family protein [Nonomuraea soli]MBA2892199.1 putative RDD family membrane protein YckC [Nonomuraea soli]